MTNLLLDRKVTKIAQALEKAGIPYAFGGAIALAYYAAPRGTEDIDLNVFLNEKKAAKCLKALARLGISVPTRSPDAHTHELVLSWEHTPIHVFFSYDPFHESCQDRTRRVPFAGRDIRILSAEDIAIFKAIYDRPKDPAEVREILLCMGERFDAAYAIEWLNRILGSEDPRTAKFQEAVAELLPTTQHPNGASPNPTQ